MCRSLYENLSEGGGSRRACVLVRCYKTHSFGDLPAALQSFVRTSSTSAGEVQWGVDNNVGYCFSKDIFDGNANCWNGVTYTSVEFTR